MNHLPEEEYENIFYDLYLAHPELEIQNKQEYLATGQGAKFRIPKGIIFNGKELKPGEVAKELGKIFVGMLWKEV